jgi:hypothetical protein
MPKERRVLPDRNRMGRIQKTQTQRLHQKHETTNPNRRKKNLQSRKIRKKMKYHAIGLGSKNLSR